MTENGTITAPQFQALCALLWGDSWRPAVADALGVGLRNVQFWAAEPPARCKPVPAGVVRELVDLLRARMADPAEADRIVRHVARMADRVRFLEQTIAHENAGIAGRV